MSKNKSAGTTKSIETALNYISQDDLNILLKPSDRRPWANEFAESGLKNLQETYCDLTPSQRGSKRRAIRLNIARAKASHYKDQWNVLLKIFNYKCASCGGECIGGEPCKDHIIPILYGGSDGIWNVQPLCRECNSSGNSEYDWRPEWLRDLLGKDSFGEYVEVM